MRNLNMNQINSVSGDIPAVVIIVLIGPLIASQVSGAITATESTSR